MRIQIQVRRINHMKQFFDAIGDIFSAPIMFLLDILFGLFK